MQLVRKLEENQAMPPELLGSHRRVIEERNKDLRLLAEVLKRLDQYE